MSVWMCGTHGRTGPMGCCEEAVRVSDQTTDAVAQARVAVYDLLTDKDTKTPHFLAVCDALDAYAAAVRAECAAKVRALPNLAIDTERHPSLAGVDVDICHRSDVLAALEAQP